MDHVKGLPLPTIKETLVGSLLRRATMAFRLQAYFTILVLILLFETSSCMMPLIRSREGGTQHSYMMTKYVHMRRALQEFILDYENGGPNPKHDRKKGKPGGKGP